MPKNIRPKLSSQKSGEKHTHELNTDELRLALPIRCTPDIPLHDGIRTLEVFAFGAGLATIPGLSKDQSAKAEQNPSTAWSVLKNTPIAPLRFESGALEFSGLPNKHFKAFAKLLGRPTIPFDDREYLENAIGHFIEASAFPELDRWRSLESHLERVINAGEAFISLLRPAMGVAASARFVPPEQTVLASLVVSTKSRSNALNCLGGTRATLDACDAALAIVRANKPKRGNKVEREFQCVMDAAVEMAKHNRALPSNASKGSRDNIRASYSTPLLRFARLAMDAALSEGVKALKASDLSLLDKKEAGLRLSTVCNKTDGALMDALRKALKNKPFSGGAQIRDQRPI